MPHKVNPALIQTFFLKLFEYDEKLLQMKKNFL